MKKIVRLTESDLTRIVKRILKEEEGMELTSDESNSDLPLCSDLMKNQIDVPGASLNLQGPFNKISANFTLAPMYQGFTVYQNNKKYCFIPKK